MLSGFFVSLFGQAVTLFQLLYLILFTLVQNHPWFRGTPWDKLYDMEAAFKPEVKNELDTQNFEKFEEVYTPTLP